MKPVFSIPSLSMIRLIRLIATRPEIRLFWVLLLAFHTGCATNNTPTIPTDTRPYSEIRLREGDSIRISFPGAPNLDTTQQVRRDGKITLSLGGEILALGKTPTELEQELLKAYESQLAVKQVVVTVNSSSYPVFVTGAVLRPGKLQADRPMTVLEAIMESGGFDLTRANMKKVKVVRQFEGQTVTYNVDLNQAFKGATTEPFYLKPSDIIFVPEKISWF